MAGEEFAGVGGVDPFADGGDGDVRVAGEYEIAGEPDLGHADFGAAIDRLALQIAKIDAVAVDDRQVADSGAGERGDDPGADPAGTDDRDPRRLEPKLPRTAKLRQDDVPGVAVEFVVGQAH